MQNGLVGQSGGPPNLILLSTAARSLIFVRWNWSAVALVTTNALLSRAVDGANAMRLMLFRCSFSFAVVCCASGVASPAFLLRNSSAEAAYSGVKLMSPDLNDEYTIARLPESVTYFTL